MSLSIEGEANPYESKVDGFADRLLPVKATCLDITLLPLAVVTASPCVSKSYMCLFDPSQFNVLAGCQLS